MTFKRKFYLYLSLIFLLSFFVFSMLADYQVAVHRIKGRIVNIEKRFWIDTWKLTIYSDGNVYEIDVENIDHVKELKQYNKKYILVDFREHLMGGPLKLKNRMDSWVAYESSHRYESTEEIISETTDHHLTCSFIAQLRNNEELNKQVHAYLKLKDFDLNSVSEKCGI